ncbi:hypothetical protein ACHAWX_002912, partial [Stephanocyclus meneghinianus]
MPAATARPPAPASNRFARLRQSLTYKRGKSSVDVMSHSEQTDGDFCANGSPSPPQESRDPQHPPERPPEIAPSKSIETASVSSTPLLATPSNHPTALKILFLSSDTGGGHRASATSLAQQFSLLFPGSIHALCDIVQLDGPPPYNGLVRMYKHLSCHPAQWKLVYSVSNTRAYEMLADVHMKSAMERAVRRRIMRYDPDVVVSVHPLMTNVPVLACANIGKETGRHLPIFTVCTDLGSAHSMWFASGVEKLFVASEAIRELAKVRGKVPEEKIVMSGLPIRNDFSLRAQNMGERHSCRGKQYQKSIRENLGLKQYTNHKIVLVMGGGEGCGRLSSIVDSLYLQFVERNIKALILVVCGRNETLLHQLSKKDWKEMRSTYVLARQKGADFESCVGLLTDAGCGGGDGYGVAHHLRRIISSPSMLGLGRVENPFSPVHQTDADRHSNGSGGERHGAGSHAHFKEGYAHATSLPGSRSHSPEIEGSESVEVITKSCAERENLYDLSTLIASVDDDNEEKIMTTVRPDTQRRSNSQSSDEDIEVIEESVSDEAPKDTESGVKVIGLGFITQMADYMVAADVLVSKAGPGTIAEAASLSLPVMLTSFLPGQEEGNVDYVIDGGFGSFISDSDPHGISEEVASWLVDEEKLKILSENAHKCGAPDAAAEIVRAIGESALRWKKINEEHSHKADEVRLEG